MSRGRSAARCCRSSDSEFVLAAIGLGVPSHRILLRDILPNVVDHADRLRAADAGARTSSPNRRCPSCRSACSRRTRAGAPSSRTARRCSIPAPGRAGARHRHRADRAGAQRPGRRRARRARPARQDPDRLTADAERRSSAAWRRWLFVMFGISVLVFLIFFATPGADPAARIAGRNAAPETLEAVRKTSASISRCRSNTCIDDEAALRHPRPDLLRQSRLEGRARRCSTPCPITLVAGARRGRAVGRRRHR